ncbi:MAG: hypothetical protein MUC37_00510 [Hyphomicrobium sp.]|nr:hypothetical protein [Hyphomicrobium sp.]
MVAIDHRLGRQVAADQESPVIAVADCQPIQGHGPQDHDGRGRLDDFSRPERSGDKQRRPAFHIGVVDASSHREVTERNHATEALSERIGIVFKNDIVFDQHSGLQHQGLLFRVIDEDLFNPICEGAATLEVMFLNASTEKSDDFIQVAGSTKILERFHHVPHRLRMYEPGFDSNEA